MSTTTVNPDLVQLEEIAQASWTRLEKTLEGQPDVNLHLPEIRYYHYLNPYELDLLRSKDNWPHYTKVLMEGVNCEWKQEGAKWMIMYTLINNGGIPPLNDLAKRYWTRVQSARNGHLQRIEAKKTAFKEFIIAEEAKKLTRTPIADSDFRHMIINHLINPHLNQPINGLFAYVLENYKIDGGRYYQVNTQHFLIWKPEGRQLVSRPNGYKETEGIYIPFGPEE